MYLQSLIDFKYKGKIYLLHPNGGEIDGYRIYKSLQDINDEIDYLISAVPASSTFEVIKDAIGKPVKAVHIFSSGFSEIEDIQGKSIQKQIQDLTQGSGVRIIGPNCMGVYCPKSGMSFAPTEKFDNGLPLKTGPMALISQSGANAFYRIREASSRGLHCCKVVSYGNAIDLDETDFLRLSKKSGGEVDVDKVDGVKCA